VLFTHDTCPTGEAFDIGKTTIDWLIGTDVTVQ
jgi:hypothetical protein